MTLCVTVTNVVLGSLSEHQPLLFFELFDKACMRQLLQQAIGLSPYIKKWISQDYRVLHSVELCRTETNPMNFEEYVLQKGAFHKSIAFAQGSA